MKPGLGWVTTHVTESLRRGKHEWGISIEHQGETNDGSGLMLGIVPKTFSKFDSFISQGGGWCLSRAGKIYGHWRRVDPANTVPLTFGTGDKVIFTLDFDTSRMSVRVGDRTLVGDINGLTADVYPAVSLHYRHQHVRFEYHKVHDRLGKTQSWTERFSFPGAAVHLPLYCLQPVIPLSSHVHQCSSPPDQEDRPKAQISSNVVSKAAHPPPVEDVIEAAASSATPSLQSIGIGNPCSRCNLNETTAQQQQQQSSSPISSPTQHLPVISPRN